MSALASNLFNSTHGIADGNYSDVIYFGDALRRTASGTIIVHNDTVLDSTNVTTTVLIRPALLRQSLPMVVVLTLAYAAVFTLAVVNNLLVVTVIYRYPALRTVTNYFLANLAVADITVSFIVLPITLLTSLFNGKAF